MAYLLVLLVSVAIGGAVYLLSLRASEGEPIAVGFEPEARTASGGPDASAHLPAGYTYLEVLVTRGPSWRERLTGLVGSLVLVVVAAAAVAAAVYGLGTAVNRVIRSFLGQ
jgi:hypothetical protein